MLVRACRSYQRWIILALFIFIAITLAIYLPALQNNFLIWDDDAYIVENPDVKYTNLNSLKNFFTTSYNGTYVPLTLLTWSIEYKIVGLNPWLYILNNILLHLSNTFLVYLLLFRLFKRKDVAIITALLFGIHPVHVESVAWITERKDVLFTFFFLLSSLKYISYAEEKNKPGKLAKAGRIGFYYSLVFFLLSALAKGQAVALAPTLFLYDYVASGKLIDKKVVMAKIPYFLIALGTSIIALHFQGFFDATPVEAYHFGIGEKIVLSTHAFASYIFIYLFPFSLSAIYPLPHPDISLPTTWYLYVFPAILYLLLLVWAFLKKKQILLFGLAFFLVNIVL